MQSLAEALDYVYTVFEPVPRPTTVDHCDHCVSPEQMDALLAAGPPRAIPVETLAPYTRNVIVRTVGSPADLRYYLPRILDIAIAQRTAWPELPMIARFLAGVDLPAGERAALRGLMRSLWRHRLATDPGADLPDAADVLCAAAHLDDDLTPYLDEWTAAVHLPEPAAQLAALLTVQARLDGGDWRMPGAWWDGRDRPVTAWLNSSALRGAVDAFYSAAPDDDDALTLVSLLVWPSG